MSQPYKIAIAGIGGVGAFYGGLLAKTYENSTAVNIHFVARGSHMQAIKQHGLQLNRDNESVTAFPQSITDNPGELGKLDLIVFCCKAYDLERFALSFSENISNETILLPLLNGVDSTETLQRLFPGTKTMYGCTYLFAKKILDGIIKITGDLNQLLLGSPEMNKEELERIAGIFKGTGANVSLHDDIKLKLWEKYSFISPMATATSAFNSSVGNILADDEKKRTLQKLMEEIVLLSENENIRLPGDIIDVNLARLSKLPAEATSSMHNDFKANNRTELETLTGYVVRQSEKLQIATPAYADLYALLKNKTIE